MDGRGAAQAAQGAPMDRIRIEAVTVEARPMLYVSQRIPMEPATVAKAVDHAMAVLGPFLKETAIVPDGPPLALYRDYHEGTVTLDVGFPVPESGAGKATGEIMAGQTPSGPAYKAVHRGPYDTLVETYEALEDSGTLRPPLLSWEVYVNDPADTAPRDLVTEIYFPRS